MPHFFKLLSLSTQFPQVQPLMRLSAGVQNCTLPCANCLRKSATGSFIAEIGAAFTAPIFFFKKETKIVLRHRKEENSELFPFGS